MKLATHHTYGTYSILLYVQHKMRKSPSQITCHMYGTIHHTNEKSTNKSMPGKWLELTNVFCNAGAE
jgi:hypothetical protein